jgi:uncharacterized protein (DUF1697 family)
MAQVVFLRGVNVGGHRVFRPARLPALLPHLALVNIGAAGTFVVRRRIARANLRRELARHLPFQAEIIIADGARIRALVARDPWARLRLEPGMVRFVSVLGATPAVEPLLPLEFRDGRRWLVKLIARTHCFVLGVYRRHLKTIGLLGRVDRLFDVPITTRNWNTIVAVAGVLDGP